MGESINDINDDLRSMTKEQLEAFCAKKGIVLTADMHIATLRKIVKANL